MAEKLILVCDVCGRNAIAKRLMDVCMKHNDNGAEPKHDHSIECRYCGEPQGSGAGLSNHVKHKHPKKWTGKGHNANHMKVA